MSDLLIEIIGGLILALIGGPFGAFILVGCLGWPPG